MPFSAALPSNSGAPLDSCHSSASLLLYSPVRRTALKASWLHVAARPAFMQPCGLPTLDGALDAPRARCRQLKCQVRRYRAWQPAAMLSTRALDHVGRLPESEAEADLRSGEAERVSDAAARPCTSSRERMPCLSLPPCLGHAKSLKQGSGHGQRLRTGVCFFLSSARATREFRREGTWCSILSTGTSRHGRVSRKNLGRQRRLSSSTAQL